MTDHQEFAEDLQTSFAAMSCPEFLKGSSVETKRSPSRVQMQLPPEDFAMFTFSDSSGKVDPPYSSRGCLWVESPIKAHAPPTTKCKWQKALRGDCFSARLLECSGAQWALYQGLCIQRGSNGDWPLGGHHANRLYQSRFVGRFPWLDNQGLTPCHPRCFAACSVSRDRLLPERFCCWACYIDNGEKGHPQVVVAQHGLFHLALASLSLLWSHVAVAIGCRSFQPFSWWSGPQDIRREPWALATFIMAWSCQGFAQIFTGQTMGRAQSWSVFCPISCAKTSKRSSSKTCASRTIFVEDHHQASLYRSSAWCVPGWWLYPWSNRKARNSTDHAPNTLPVKVPPAPLRGSVACAAALSYNARDAETEVEEVVFKADPGELLHGTHFLRATNDKFSRMGWEKPGTVFAGFVDREVNNWIFTCSQPCPIFANRESWHAKWIAWLPQWKNMHFTWCWWSAWFQKVMLRPAAFSPKIREKTLTMAHVHGKQLKKELEVGNTLRPKQIELLYFHAMVQHVRSVFEFEYPVLETGRSSSHSSGLFYLWNPILRRNCLWVRSGSHEPLPGHRSASLSQNMRGSTSASTNLHEWTCHSGVRQHVFPPSVLLFLFEVRPQ